MSIEKAITGGTICIEDGLKAKEEFAPARKVKVELTFSVPEGENGKAYMEGVTRVCDTKVREMLGKAPATATAVVAPVAAAGEAAKVETPAAKKKREAAEAKALEAAKPERTKADLEREAGLPVTVTVTGKTDEELLEDEPTITANGKPAAEEDDLGDLLGEAAPAPITDLELGKAAQDKNAKMKAELGEKWAPAKIRDLIAKASDGKRINDIPVAKRAQFLKDIEAIK